MCLYKICILCTGKTVDEYAEELIAPSGEGDTYDMLVEGRQEAEEGREDEPEPLMSFGKAVAHDRGKALVMNIYYVLL